MERASCLLATGVKLSRMTEPGEEEWWVLAEVTRKSLNLLRVRWDLLPQFEPKVFALKPPAKQKLKSTVKTFEALPPSTVAHVWQLLFFVKPS